MPDSSAHHYLVNTPPGTLIKVQQTTLAALVLMVLPSWGTWGPLSCSPFHLHD